MAADDNTATAQPSSGRRRIDSLTPEELAAAAKPADDAGAAVVAQPAPEDTTAEAAKAAENAAAIAANEGVDLYSAPVETAVLMKAPMDCAPFDLRGKEHTPDEHGLVEVPAEFVETLKSHGFEVV